MNENGYGKSVNKINWHARRLGQKQLKKKFTRRIQANTCDTI